MKDRRIGKLLIKRKLLDKAIDSGDGANLFHMSVPLDVKHDFISGNVEMILWHPQFRPIAENEMVPEYEALFMNGRIFPIFTEIIK